MTELFIDQRRGFALEAVHAIDAVACHASGKFEILAGVDALTTFRSAGKPFQLEVSLEHLPRATRARLSPRELALGAASHHGERFHLEGLAQLFATLELGERDLYCGVHPPLHAASAQALFARGEQPGALHNNCAGKHAFMAAAARARGWAVDYRPAEHPLQQAIRERLDLHTDHGLAGSVVDGCGVPCFVLKLSAMARAYAGLARALRIGGASPLAIVGRAMREHPLLVSGSEAFDGWLMQHARALAKVGAAGLLCLALPERELGIALKARSGSELARPIATALLLARHVPGLLQSELPARFRIVHNLVGAEVGELVGRFQEH